MSRHRSMKNFIVDDSSGSEYSYSPSSSSYSSSPSSISSSPSSISSSSSSSSSPSYSPPPQKKSPRKNKSPVKRKSPVRKRKSSSPKNKSPLKRRKSNRVSKPSMVSKWVQEGKFALAHFGRITAPLKKYIFDMNTPLEFEYEKIHPIKAKCDICGEGKRNLHYKGTINGYEFKVGNDCMKKLLPLIHMRYLLDEVNEGNLNYKEKEDYNLLIEAEFDKFAEENERTYNRYNRY